MKPEIAIKIFNKVYPDLQVCGYWDNGKEIIVNTVVEDLTILDQPAQCVVGKWGKVLPTNPARHNLTADNYVELSE